MPQLQSCICVLALSGTTHNVLCFSWYVQSRHIVHSLNQAKLRTSCDVKTLYGRSESLWTLSCGYALGLSFLIWTVLAWGSG